MLRLWLRRGRSETSIGRHHRRHRRRRRGGKKGGTRKRERERDVELVPGAYTIASPCRNNGAWMSHRVQSQSAIFRRGISQGNGRFVVLLVFVDLRAAAIRPPLSTDRPNGPLPVSFDACLTGPPFRMKATRLILSLYGLIRFTILLRIFSFLLFLSLSLVSEVKVFCSLLSKFWKWNFESFLRTNKIWIIYVYIFIVHLFILLCRVIRATSPEDPEVVQLVERESRAVTNSNI